MHLAKEILAGFVTLVVAIYHASYLRPRHITRTFHACVQRCQSGRDPSLDDIIDGRVEFMGGQGNTPKLYQNPANTHLEYNVLGNEPGHRDYMRANVFGNQCLKLGIYCSVKQINRTRLTVHGAG